MGVALNFARALRAFFTLEPPFIESAPGRGHVGCSRGYSLDSYKSMNIRSINSQVNEQANAGLQRIKAQLAYMKPDNFKFTLTMFLCITNMDKVNALDLSGLLIR